MAAYKRPSLLRKIAAVFTAQPVATLFFIIVVAVNFVFWGQLFGMVWQTQVVLMALTVIVGFVIGFWWSELRSITQFEKAFKYSADTRLYTMKDALEKGVEQLDDAQRELRALRAENSDLRGRVQIIETCLDGLSFSWVIDSEGDMQFSSIGQNFNRFFRLDRTDFLEDWSLILPEVHSKDRKAFELFLSRFDAFPAKESFTFEMARAAHEGARFLTMTVRREMGKKQMRVFGVLVDVTELMVAKQQADSEFRVKADFLATISHELRTPLNSIIGFSKMLTSQLKNEPELQQDASNIVLAGESLNVILNDILDYNRIQAEGIRLDSQPFDLNELLSHVYRLNKPIADQKGLGFKLVNRTVDSPMLLGDVNRLRQVFQNLVNNAIKFTEDGHVEIRVYGSEPANGRMQLVVEIEDTGVGIGKAEMRRLFKPFSQGSREVNRRFGGTGLGLAISSGLVERMGGNIDVTSEPDVGSVFSVQLNLALSKRKKQKEKGQSVSTEPIHILAVDDHPLNLKLLDRFLKKSGHTVKMAESGQDAIDMAEAEQFDLILMDIDMPEMDGHEATQRIKKGKGKSKNTPICAVSGLVDEATREKSMSVGMHAHLGKPVSFTELKSLIVQISHNKQHPHTEPAS